jgi:hypothetical protein
MLETVAWVFLLMTSGFVIFAVVAVVMLMMDQDD